jgi:hypothetical protein
VLDWAAVDVQFGRGRFLYWRLWWNVERLRLFCEGYVRGVRLLFQESSACRRTCRAVELQLGVKAISFLIDRVSAFSVLGRCSLADGLDLMAVFGRRWLVVVLATVRRGEYSNCDN